MLLALTACQGGAVVFAPTPLPPDLSPLRYDHPGGAFSLNVPRNWSVFTQNTPVLASASFSPPDTEQPLLTVAMVNLGSPIGASGLGALMAEYQSTHRPDRATYREQDRSAMGDGSWRIAGVRTPGSGTQELNTFIEASGSLLSVIEVIITPDAARMAELQTAINTFRINEAAPLQPSTLATLGFARATAVDAVNIASWTTPAGVFFVTGELVNNSDNAVAPLPVQVAVVDENGEVLDSATDLTMGYGVAAGGFMPFSVRFGAGQPPTASRYVVQVTLDTLPTPELPIYGRDVLSWEDQSTFADNGDLLITGTVTNNAAFAVRDPLAVVTVFDPDGRAIGAWFTPLSVTRIAPGDSVGFEVRVAELGGDPINYIVEIQALGE